MEVSGMTVWTLRPNGQGDVPVRRMPAPEVEWDAAGEVGVLRRGGATFECFSRREAARRAFSAACTAVALTPTVWNAIARHAATTAPAAVRAACTVLALAYPPFTPEDMDTVATNVVKDVIRHLRMLGFCEPTDDFKFVLRIGFHREWSYDACALCKVAVRTVGCSDHTLSDPDCTLCRSQAAAELDHAFVMFSPCGHTVCLDPCYVSIAAAQGIRHFERRTIDCGHGIIFSRPLTVNVDGKAAFDCSQCRGRVHRVFQTDEVAPPPSVPDGYLDDIDLFL